MHEGRQVRRPAVDEVDPLGGGLQAEHVDDLVEEFGERDLVAVQTQDAVFDFRDVEDAVDEVGEMLGAAPDHADGVVRRAGGATLEQLRVAIDGIERRADLVADAGDVARLGDVGGLGDFLRFLQRRVGAFVRVDFVHEHGRLSRRLRLGRAPALMRKHDEPGHDARHHEQREIHQPQCGADGLALGGQRPAVLLVDEP